MATRVKYTRFVLSSAVLLSMCGVSFAGKSVGVEIECGEIQVRITVKRQLFKERGIPFKPDYVRLGTNSTQQRSCVPRGPISESELVISAGLQECGTESSVREGSKKCV